MLDSIFMQVLDMSKTASIVILVVLLARLLLKKVPKVFSYALWAVVLFRLLCPFTFEATLSIMPEMASVSQDYSLSEAPISVLGAAEAAYHAVGDALNGGLGVQDIRTTEKDEEGRTKYVGSLWREVWILFGQYVWVAGIGVMLLYSAVSYLKIRKKLLVLFVLVGCVIHTTSNSNGSVQVVILITLCFCSVLLCCVGLDIKGGKSFAEIFF